MRHDLPPDEDIATDILTAVLIGILVLVFSYCIGTATDMVLGWAVELFR